MGFGIGDVQVFIAQGGQVYTPAIFTCPGIVGVAIWDWYIGDDFTFIGIDYIPTSSVPFGQVNEFPVRGLGMAVRVSDDGNGIKDLFGS